jgi:hypothetical protein
MFSVGYFMPGDGIIVYPSPFYKTLACQNAVEECMVVEKRSGGTKKVSRIVGRENERPRGWVREWQCV